MGGWRRWRCRRGPALARFLSRADRTPRAGRPSIPAIRGALRVALPPLTSEQRTAALEKAAEARRTRAELKAKLKHSAASLADVLAAGDADVVIGKMKVAAVLEAMPGVGKVR